MTTVRVGVTGHRRIDDPEGVSAAVLDALARVRERFAGAQGVRLEAVSPLAEGADRIVARAVLAEAGAALTVPLPFPAEDYATDFAEPASKAEFDELLARAARVEVMPPAASRDDGYEHVGRWVVEHSDVLLALWDGAPSRGRGGTAEIVQYARDYKRPLIVINPTTGETKIERGHGLSSQSLRAVEEFSRFTATAKGLESYERNIFTDTFVGPEGKNLPAESKDLVRGALIPWYARASLIAKENQDIYRLAGRLVYLLSPLSVALAAAGTIFHEYDRWAFLLEALCLGAIFIIIFSADRQRAHRRWTEHRVLAEYLRTAIHLAVAATEVPRWRIPPYLGVSRPTGDWILRVFREVWDDLPTMTGCTGELCCAHAAFVRNCWIHGQVSFHRNKARECATSVRTSPRR